MGGLVWGWHGCRLGCSRNIVAKPLSFPFFSSVLATHIPFYLFPPANKRPKRPSLWATREGRKGSPVACLLAPRRRRREKGMGGVDGLD